MIKETTYHSDWQQNRINFILSKYPKEFFNGKRILELGAHNGYIGAYFSTLGADVHCIEGRPENVENIKLDYPEVTVEVANLDSTEWKWGKWDIIINFGLYYHLENFHKEHLKNCIDNCDLMFFESVIYDSFESEIYFRTESGIDQSLTPIGGTPSTSFVENIFNEMKCDYKKYSDGSLNALASLGDNDFNKMYNHHYNWPDTDSKIFNQWNRRFWIVNSTK
jgi:hypothetical protein